MTRRRDRHPTAGQALVEMALVLPMFLLLFLGAFDFGRVIWAHNTVETAAREAARYAIVHGGTALTTCPEGPDAQGRPTCDGRDPLAATEAVARGWTGPGTTVEICYGAGCAGTIDAAGATNKRGTPVTVHVASRVDLVLGGLVRFVFPSVAAESMSVDSRITMLVNT